MPQNSREKRHSWTELHEAFCHQHHICPAAKILWQWLARLGEGIELEPHLKNEFNTWIAKIRGKGFSDKWLKHIFNKLVECRVIRIIKKFTSPYEFRLVLRPISWLNPPKKSPEQKSRKLNSTSTLDPSNAQSVEDVLGSSSNSSTHISTEEFQELERRHEILKTCGEYQIYFHPNKPTTNQLFEFDIEDIREALKHFVKRGGHEKYSSGKPMIPNPQGWLIRCLQNCYWEDQYFRVDQFSMFLKSLLPTNLPRDY